MRTRGGRDLSLFEKSSAKTFIKNIFAEHRVLMQYVVLSLLYTNLSS